MLAAETSTKPADSTTPNMSNLCPSQLPLSTCSSTPQVIPLSYRFINTTSPPPDQPHSPLTPTLRILLNKQDSLILPALSPTVSLLPPSVRKLLDNFMLRYQRLTDMSFFGPAKWQIARTREVFSQRLQTSATSLWSMLLLTKIVDAMFDGVRPSETSFDMFRRWFKLHETWATSSHSLTLGEPQGRLSGNLEVCNSIQSNEDSEISIVFSLRPRWHSLL
ncbi:hypothetical protein FRC12_000388 [Ceratobasidium sp. 428]|nr:hypothetical protein FRC12_000388 [Ceratobasidium sp. 428]